jgi:hypothetical protein
MTPQLKQYLNRSILVSIPALYEDGRCRAYTLRGFGTDGLWLNSEELVQRLLHENGKSAVAENPLVFVPFAQIAGIVFATVTPAAPTPPPIPVETPAAASSASPPAVASTKGEPSTPTPIPAETPAPANSPLPPAAPSTKVEPPAKRSKSTR